MEIKKNILIIDNSNLSYSGEDINGTILRGTETSLILLAEEFNKKDINVFFATKIDESKIVRNVNYINTRSINKEIYYDLVIAVSDANLLKNIRSYKKVIFSVSIQSIEKFIRKGQLLATYLYKPTIVTLCEYQFKKRSFITSPYGKTIIPIAVDKIFLEEPIDINFIPEKKAIYNIRSNRNLDELINIWENYVYPKDKDSKFYITPDLIEYNANHKKITFF